MIGYRFRILLFLIILGSPGHRIIAQDKPLQLVVLGVAQDAGVPQAGCEKACCLSPKRTFVSSLAVFDPTDGKIIFFDASPDLPTQLKQLQQTTGHNSLMPSAIFLTHAHMGHYSGLLHFGREASNTQDLPVYVLPRMRRFIENNAPWSQLVDLENIALSGLRPGNSVSPIKRLSVIPLEVPHRDEYSETAAFLIKGKDKTALYLPDIDKWHLWKYRLADILREVDFAFLDATFYSKDELPGRNLDEIPHPTVKETVHVLKDLPAEQRSKVYFIHLNHTNPLLDKQSPERQKLLDQGFRIAEENLILPL